MKLKKITSYTNKRNIWRLLISENNKLLVEERDVNKKEAFFNLVDIAKGKVLWKDFQFDEKFWIGVEAIYKDVIIFHKFGKPDMPGHKEVIVYSLVEKEFLWKTDEFGFFFVHDNKILCIRKGFDKHKYVALDYKTGLLTDDYEDDFITVNELKLASNLNNSFSGYSYAGDFSSIDDTNNGIKEVINNVGSGYDVTGKIEVLIFHDYILFNFHHKNKNNTLTNRFFAFDGIKKKKLMEEVLNESTNAVVPDSFFMKDNFLFLLKEKNAILIYTL